MGRLYDYQEKDISRRLKAGSQHYRKTGELDEFRLPLFADMGTGKTPATIVYLDRVREFLKANEDHRGDKPILVICPASVKFNWLDEIREWSDVGPADVWMINGPRPAREQQIELMKLLRPKWTITNYDTIRIHQQAFQNLGDEDNPFFLAVVADEAHYIKWSKSQRTAAVRSIMADFHVGLTGTPLSNKVDSLWGVLHWMDNTPPFERRVGGEFPTTIDCPRHRYACTYCPAFNRDEWVCREGGKHTEGVKPKKMRYRSSGQWGSFDNFKSTYCTFDWYGRVTGAKPWKLPDLHRRLEKFGMVRWRLSEVLDTKTLAYEYVSLQLTPQQARVYNALRDGFLEVWGAEGEYLGREKLRSMLAQLMYFRRITTLTPREFQLSLNGKNPAFAPDLSIPMSDDGCKQGWILEHAKSLNGDKMIVFSDWTSFLRPLSRRLQKAGFDELVPRDGALEPSGKVNNPKGYTAIIDGNTKPEVRQMISRRWNEDPQFKVFLGSPAAFEGINMQGGLDDEGTVYVVLANLPWVPKDVFQAIGRALRAGQPAQVVAVVLSARQTIDEQMARTLKNKQADFDDAIDGGKQRAAAFFNITGVRSALDLIGKGVDE